MRARDAKGRFKATHEDTGPCVVCGEVAPWNRNIRAFRCFTCGMARMQENMQSLHYRYGAEYDRWSQAYEPWREAIETGTGERATEWRRRWLAGVLRSAGIDPGTLAAGPGDDATTT